MSILWVIVYWLHLLATVAWIGGMIFYVLVLVPAMGAIDPPQRGRLVGAILKRYAPLAWGAVIVLIVTGVLISRFLGGRAISFASTSGIVMFVKHATILVMVVIGAIVSFVIGPKMRPPAQAPAGPPSGDAGASPPAGPPPQMIKLQKRAGALGVVNLILGVVVLFLTELLQLV